MYGSEYSQREERKSSRRPPLTPSSGLPDAAGHSQTRHGFPQLDRTHEQWEESPSRRPKIPVLMRTMSCILETEKKGH